MPNTHSLPLSNQATNALALPNDKKGIALHGAGKASEAQIEKTAQKFEATFLSQMMQHMFNEVQSDELFGGGYAGDVYKSMMVNEYGKLMASSGGIGIADHVKREMLAMQEGTTIAKDVGTKRFALPNGNETVAPQPLKLDR